MIIQKNKEFKHGPTAGSCGRIYFFILKILSIDVNKDVKAQVKTDQRF